MARARDIISRQYDKPESKHGATRSTLFGKFYERILARWLEEKRLCTLRRWPDKRVNKPTIYWKEVSAEGLDFGEHEKLRVGMVFSLNSKVSHCTPDGVFEKDGQYYIWEAKNWPLYPEKGPKDQILNYMKLNPWVLANSFELQGAQYNISGFWFSYWSNSERDRDEIREAQRVINSIIGNGRLDIILTDEVLDDCIVSRYPWYTEIIEQEKADVEQFFRQLLGRV